MLQVMIVACFGMVCGTMSCVAPRLSFSMTCCIHMSVSGWMEAQNQVGGDACMCLACFEEFHVWQYTCEKRNIVKHRHQGHQ